MRTVILSATPLSARYAEELKRRLTPEIEFVVLARLRTLGLTGLLRELRRLARKNVYVAFEDGASQTLVPILEIFAVATLPTNLALVDGNFHTTAIHLGGLLSDMLGLGRASLKTARAAWAAHRELTTLDGPAQGRDRPGTGRHVLYLNTNLWFGLKAGGSVAHVAGIVNGLGRAGFEVEAAALSRPPLISATTRFRQIPAPAVLGLPSELNQYVVQRALVADVLARRDATYRFIYQRLTVHSYAGAVLARALKVPLVVEYNGSEVWVARNWGRPLRYEDLARRSEEVLLAHADLVVTVSDVLRDELVRRGLPSERILSYPNGFDPELLNPSRFDRNARTWLLGRLGIPSDSLVVMFIGTFGRWHGTETLAEAIRGMVEQNREWLDARRVRFLIVGDGLRMPQVREILRGVPSDYVTLTGLVPQEEAPAYLASADIAVSPHVTNADASEFFGSPTKLFEYMAMAKPIVASDLAQIGEILRPALDVHDLPVSDPDPTDERLAILVRPGTVEDLTAAIRFLVERPAWRSALGDRARARALARHTWDHQIQLILDHLGDGIRG